MLAKIARPDGNIDEPAIAELKDGRLILVTRPDGAVFFSKDKGKTWNPTSTRIVPKGSAKFKAPQLIVLRDGTVVAVASWRGLRAWISTNQGKSWSKSISLDTSSYGYPGSWILAEGESIVLPYCSSGRAPNSLYLLRFRIDRQRKGVELLPLTPIR